MDESKCNMAPNRDSADVGPRSARGDADVIEDFETVEALTKLCAQWSALLHEMVENGTPPTAAAEAMLTVALDAARCLEGPDLSSGATANPAHVQPLSSVTH